MVHCFLVLCGLPASGKSTLAQKLKTSELISKFHIVVLSYDDLMPDNLKEFLTDNRKLSAEGDSTWKKYREDILDCIDYVLSTLPEVTEGRPEKVSNELWLNFQKALKSFHNDKKNQLEDFNSLIVIDDNMYYRGMRYDFYQMARKHGCGFCQIYLRINVKGAIARNRNRLSPIPDQVIETMASKLEPPCPDAKTWETHSLTIESDALQDLNAIFALVQTAQEHPAPPFHVYTDLYEMQARNRRQCSASCIHQVDQILRRLVSEKMASINANIGAVEKKKAACNVREIKMKILSDLKSGELVIPADVENVQDACRDSSSHLYVWLDGIFKSYG